MIMKRQSYTITLACRITLTEQGLDCRQGCSLDLDISGEMLAFL